MGQAITTTKHGARAALRVSSDDGSELASHAALQATVYADSVDGAIRSNTITIGPFAATAGAQAFGPMRMRFGGSVVRLGLSHKLKHRSQVEPATSEKTFYGRS